MVLFSEIPFEVFVDTQLMIFGSNDETLQAGQILSRIMVQGK